MTFPDCPPPSPGRLLHLIVLCITSFAIGQLLINKYEWKPLAGYSLGVTVAVQISKIISGDFAKELKAGMDSVDSGTNAALSEKQQEKREKIAEKRRERRSGGGPSKKNS